MRMLKSELQMLSSLHGIDVLLINIESLFDSQILIPASEDIYVIF